MTRKLYHLSSCTTCQQIIKDTGINQAEFVMQDIKTEKITAAQLDELKQMAGSYENLFSRRALLYKSMGLKDKVLTEDDIRRLILEEYTFLKRPVAIIGKELFVGNAPKTVAALREKVSSL